MPKQNIRDAEKLHHSWAADGSVEDKFSLKRLLKPSHLRTSKTKTKENPQTRGWKTWIGTSPIVKTVVMKRMPLRKIESSFQNGRNHLQTKHIRGLHPECTKKSYNSIMKSNPIKNWQKITRPALVPANRWVDEENLVYIHTTEYHSARKMARVSMVLETKVLPVRAL